MCDRHKPPPNKRARLSSENSHSITESLVMEGDVEINTQLGGSAVKSSMKNTIDRNKESQVIQSLNDKRQYRVISLHNGLRALLVSDLSDEEAQQRSLQPVDQSDVETDDETPEVSEEEEEEEKSDEDELEEGQTRKLSKKRTKKPKETNKPESEEEEEDEECEDDEGEEVEGQTERHPKKHGKNAKETVKPAAAALCIGSGSFSDPEDIPGLAHFLEHMVFMGSEKYPEENSFDAFINKHGGFDNAFTDCERTVFYFEVNRRHFREALDRFAQFFISPLMKKDSVDRETQAVDSEFMMSQVSDTCRKQQLIGACAQDGHPMGKFFWGNTLSLKQQPAEQGIDVYDRLASFYKNVYSSHYMTLVVQAKETLDDLQEWTTDIFSDVPHNEIDQQSFTHLTNPFNPDKFNKLYKLVPVKDIHQLELTWALPSMLSHYRVKPLHYIGWLVGHEGKGSLLSYLKSRCWALSVSSGNGEQGFEYNQTCAFFTITLTLTTEGFEHSNDVLTAVFQYLAMLCNVGPSQRVYEEIQTIENNEFRWKEESSPSDYVQKLSENMQLYPPEHYLMGDELLFDYDPKIIEDCQNWLVPEKANILFLSKNFEKEGICDQKEPWFGTSYTVCDIEDQWKETWKKPSPCEHFHLPETNEYIASDFSLRSYRMEDPPEGWKLSPPVKLSDTNTSRLWFKADSKFNVPKAYIFFHLSSPMVNESATSVATFELFVKLLTHNLSEIAYAADVAQLNYEFCMHSGGLEIKLNGFNHKLQKLFETIITHIADFTIDEGMFEVVKQQMTRSYYNKMIKADHLVKEARFATLYQRFHSTAEKRSALQGVDVKALEEFVTEYRRNCYIEGFVHGNYNPEEAVSIHNYIISKLNNSLSRSETFKHRVLNLPNAEQFLKIKSFNQTDPNSAVVCYYQHGPGDLENATLNELLEMIMEEPCFDYLRTQEQLGYSVYSNNLVTNGIIGMSITVQVQATKFSTTFVESKIRDFLTCFAEKLDNFTEEQFEEHVKSLITMKSCEDVYLGEEAQRHWSEIHKDRCLFHRLDLEIEILSKLTLKGVKAWFRQLMMAEDKKKISIQVVGCETEKVDGDDQKAAPPELFENAFNLVQVEGDSHHINDLETFKTSLKFYPVSQVLPKINS